MEKNRRAREISEGERVAVRDHGGNDESLVELARRDPGAGWAAIWDAHGAALHGYCRRLLDDSSDADDVVADVFLVAAQRIDQLRDPTALRAWLFSISRRSVQRRWRARSRTVPVDPQGTAVMSRATDTTVDELSSVVARDAAELVDAAAAGLSIDDQELLALTLGADLDTTEVARITGQKQSAVSVRVTRLKDSVARAAGALLVARHHRRECEDLDDLLASWDGSFDPLWRKRIARHVDRCDNCDDRRRGAVAAFASPLLVAPAPLALRDRVLASIDAAPPGSRFAADSADPDEWSTGDDGFPEPKPWTVRRGRRPAVALAVATGLVIALVIGIVAMGGDDDPDVVAVADTVTTTAPTTTTEPPVTTTSAPEEAPVTDPIDEPGDVTPPPAPTIVPPPAEPPPPPPPVIPPPTVSLSLDPPRLTTCGSTSGTVTATVVVGVGAGDEVTTLSWDGGAPGSTEVEGPGTHEVEVGPIQRDTSGPLSQTVTVTATTIDSDGASATDTDAVTIDVVPC